MKLYMSPSGGLSDEPSDWPVYVSRSGCLSYEFPDEYVCCCNMILRICYVVDTLEPVSDSKVSLRDIVDEMIVFMNTSIKELVPAKADELVFNECENPTKEITSCIMKLWTLPFLKKRITSRKKNTDYPEIILRLAHMFKLLHKFEASYARACGERGRIDQLRNGKLLADIGELIYQIYKRFVVKYCRGYEDIAWFLFEDKYHLHFLSQYWKDNASNQQLSERWNEKDFLREMCVELLLPHPDTYKAIMQYLQPIEITKRRLPLGLPMSFEEDNRRWEYATTADTLKICDALGFIEDLVIDMTEPQNPKLNIPIAEYSDMEEVVFENVEDSSRFAVLYHIALMHDPTREALYERFKTALKNHFDGFPSRQAE